MKTKISALMDGELESRELESAIATLRSDHESIDAWRVYHLIGDALRDTQALSAGFSAALAERLAREPTVVAPRKLQDAAGAGLRRFALSAAASVGAVALVGWLAFAPQPGGQPVHAPIAENATPASVIAAGSEGVDAPLSESASDYLLAHQAYSPSLALQGVATYARTVSAPVPGARAR